MSGLTDIQAAEIDVVENEELLRYLKTIFHLKKDKTIASMHKIDEIVTKHFEELQSEQECTIDQLLESCNGKYQEKQLKVFRSILDNADVIRRNWRLVLLDMQNLSHQQIVKVNNIIENNDEKIDKMGMMRLLLKNGIQNLNVERGFLTFKINKIQKGN